jgi:hypothetical protein
MPTPYTQSDIHVKYVNCVQSMHHLCNMDFAIDILIYIPYEHIYIYNVANSLAHYVTAMKTLTYIVTLRNL